MANLLGTPVPGLFVMGRAGWLLLSKPTNLDVLAPRTIKVSASFCLIGVGTTCSKLFSLPSGPTSWDLLFWLALCTALVYLVTSHRFQPSTQRQTSSGYKPGRTAHPVRIPAALPTRFQRTLSYWCLVQKLLVNIGPMGTT